MGENPRFYKRWVEQYPAGLSGGFQSPTEINASGGSQPRKEEGASHHARRGKNAENPRFYKRWVEQYPAGLSGGFQSPTEINAPRGCAGIRICTMSAYADPNPAPSLASET